MKHAVILVVYQKQLADCEAGKTLSLALPEECVVCVYDNSENAFGNLSFSEKQGWIYLTEGQNNGIATAYQSCIDRLLATGFEGWISIFDDDTQICSDYFTALDHACADRPNCSLFFPLLYAGDKLISPQIIPINQHARYFDSKRDCLTYTGENLYAFNSGMAVHSRVYEQIRYDTRLFLDGVDYSFLRDCYRAGFQAASFGAEMIHGFSGTQSLSYEAALKRFENYARDHGIVLQENSGGYIYLIGKRALHLALLYKKTIFLRIFWKYRPKGAQNHEI